MTWQKRARIGIAVAAVGFTIVVVLAFKRGGSAPPAVAPVVQTDPKAVVESTGGRLMRFNRAQEEVRIEYERQLTYADGSTKLMGVKVVTDDRGGGRSFTVSGKEGQVGEKESTYTLQGDVRLVASDGFTATTDRATYDKDGIVHAPGRVEFSDSRMSGSGMGMRYDKNADVLTILDQASMSVAADKTGSGAADVASGAAFFGRREKIVRFERGITVTRGGQVIEADNGVAHLTADEQQIETLELHGNARVSGSVAGAGGLRALNGHDLTLTYGPDGQSLQRAVVSGDAGIQMAGDAGKPGGAITGGQVDVTLAPDGATPTALVARENVRLTFPVEPKTPARTVTAEALDAVGDARRGLTKAVFTGRVEFKERGAGVERTARAVRLEVGLKPALGAIDQATFIGGARFDDAKVSGTAASLKYAVDAGTLELTGTEPAMPVPHVSNDRIAVDATRIDVTLAGPVLHATGGVKSRLQAPKKAGEGSETKLPSMLKQDQPVNVTADALDYDGTASKATYKGSAQLWQSETTIKADTIALDDKAGDLTAAGSVATTTMLTEVDKNKKRQRTRSNGTAGEFVYEEAARRATYTGDAHLIGAQGDMTARKIELYLKSSGDELDRAEAYDDLILREQNRKTTGSRMTYTAADERYDVTGSPVKIVDQCGRETSGRTLTFHTATDTIDVDGDERIRTQTKGGDKCP